VVVRSRNVLFIRTVRTLAPAAAIRAGRELIDSPYRAAPLMRAK
jgi:hypothetical protein